ncbi:hypothetical protein AAFF_G00169270 [Aldrovandia affinis]|uniref:SH2 domain-containing protein n=1 Tax=Aldrovandia affinis TaxID=143900 RepID=A0AAD7W7B7_9TELE|nr:hypothetical protein AAFF_G00169270 [Aldrovandia affinis]
MDFDYQTIKDSEMRQREALIRSLPAPQPRQPPSSQIPPVKPRRSIKSRPSPLEEAGPPSQPANSREGETMVQKVSPAVRLCRAPGALEPLSPSLRAHTLLWFERSQLPRLRQPGQPLPRWLHGFATRREAEELLKDEAQGCFLVRLSESKTGFVLSYRGRDRCRHFFVEEEGGGAAGGGCYLITGEESRHGSLQGLVRYYSQHAVGPFNEVLTTPCLKGKWGSENLQVESVGVGDSGGAVGAEQEPNVIPSVPRASETTPGPVGGAAPPSETAQYAVVRKGLRKAHSLPDSRTEGDTEVPNFIPAPPREASGPEGDRAKPESSDPQYARVNKPLRVLVNPAPPSSSADAHPDPFPGPQVAPALSRRGSAGEQKYWELMPMHTYEATDHLTHREESHDQIDFYAMGRRQGAEGGEGEVFQNHLYSEVNLRGLRDGSAAVPIPPPARSTPGLPLRPPPRMTDCPPHLDPALQRLDGRLPLTPPSRPGLSLPLPDNHTSVYEQIPERGPSARPPLPPANHRH